MVYSGQEIHMTFTVSSGTVDFWVMDDHEYNNLVAYYDNAAPAIDYMMKMNKRMF
jgi:hypothetical protein